jgi:hypothetical protein
MIQYTQSDLEQGNCWQTAVACILEVVPKSLPPQVYWEQQTNALNGWANYLNVLNGYLGIHHGLVYSEVYDYAFRVLQVKEPGYHLLIGPTVRSAEQEEKGALHTVHTVVGLYGELIWDPYPSRAGLTYVKQWGVLSPIPDRMLKQRNELSSRDADYKRVMQDCLCPAHYHYED